MENIPLELQNAIRSYDSLGVKHNELLRLLDGREPTVELLMELVPKLNLNALPTNLSMNFSKFFSFSMIRYFFTLHHNNTAFRICMSDRVDFKCHCAGSQYAMMGILAGIDDYKFNGYYEQKGPVEIVVQYKEGCEIESTDDF